MSGFTSIFGSSGSSKADSSSGLSTSTLGHSSNEIKQQIQQQIAQELAVANATELVNVSYLWTVVVMTILTDDG